MQIALAFTLFILYQDNSLSGECLSSFESEEQIYPVNCIGKEPVQVGWSKRKCDCKAYPYKVCPDRNRIRFRVNKIGYLSRYM